MWAALALAAIPLSGQIHLAMGAVVLALGYAWARVPRSDWWKAAAGAAVATAAAVAVQQIVVAGSIAGGGRSFGQVRRYSAELSDFVTRGVGAGIEEYVFLGWLTPVLALAGLWAIRRRGGLAWFLGLSALIPCLLALGANLPLYEPLWRVLPPLRFARVPERLLPIACLAIAALVAFALDFVAQSHKVRVPAAVVTAAALILLAVDLHAPVFGAVAPDSESSAYAAIRGDGRLLELPVFRPDIHFGSVYLGYARQSPRERPQGYSTTAPPAADRLARQLRGRLVRSRVDPTGARRALRGRAPRALRAERVLRARLCGAGGGCPAARRLEAARARRCDLELATSLTGSQIPSSRNERTRDRLPGGDPQRERLRRRDRDAAAGGAAPVGAARQPAAPEAGRPPARLLVQAPRRVQQDVPPAEGSAASRRRRGIRRQPRPGRRARGAAARHDGDDRDAGDDAADQGRLGHRARCDRRARGRLVRRRLRRGDAHHAPPQADVRPSLRRRRRDRRPGHDRDGDPAPAARADRHDLRRRRRRRADRRDRRVREAPPPGDPHRRRRADRRERDGALAEGRPPDHAPPRRPLRRRRRGEAGRRRAVPARSQATSTR